MKKFIPLIGVFVVLLFSYWSITHLLLPGFFPMHDDTQPTRVSQMATALKDGMFPVRWVPDLGYGYGYPIFTFYAPLAYYVGATIHLLGFDALLATKIMIVLGVLISGISMYSLARSVWGEVGGIVSALLFVYAPYHAVNIYVRGAVGELYGYAFIPLIFYGLFKLYQTGKFRYVVIGSLGYAATLLSHNLTGMMITPFVVLSLLILTVLSLRRGKRKIFYFLQATFILGLILSAFYWLPALTEMSYTNVISQVGGAADFREHYVCPLQLWESPWGYGGSAKGCVDGMSFKIGKLHIFFIALSFLSIPFVWKDKKRLFLLLLGCFFLAVSVFLSLDISKVIWKTFVQLAFVQYPWRFLALIAFFGSFISGASLWVLTVRLSILRKYQLGQYLFVGILAAAIVLFNYKLFVPQTILPKTAGSYTEEKVVRFQISRISDEYLPQGFLKPFLPEQVPTEKIMIVDGDGKVQSLREKTQRVEAVVQAKTDLILLVNIAYFPGWQIYLDGNSKGYSLAKNGYLINLPKGKHTLLITYSGTQIEFVANSVSLIGAVLLITGIIISQRKRLL